MAKAKNALQYAMTLAAAIVITLGSKLAWAWPGQRLWEEGKKGLKAGEDMYVGKMTFEAHIAQFFAEMSPRDLIGRSSEASLVLAGMFLGLSFILLRKHEAHGRKIPLVLLLAYVPSVAYGLGYEFLVTSPSGSAKAFAAAMFFGPLIVVVIGLILQLNVFKYLALAIRKGQIGHFLRHRQLKVAEPQQAPPQMPGMPMPGMAGGPMMPLQGPMPPGQAPLAPPGAAMPPVAPGSPLAPLQPQPPPPPRHRALPPIVICQSCGNKTQGGAPHCGRCKAPMPQQGQVPGPPGHPPSQARSAPVVPTREAQVDDEPQDPSDYWADAD